MKSGVITSDRTVTAIIVEFREAEIQLFCKPIWALRNANSPICARYRAISRLVLKWSFRTGTAAANHDLNDQYDQQDQQQCSQVGQYIFEREQRADVTKKSMEKIACKGLISVMISWLRTLSEIINPARNAPSVEETPNFSASRANSSASRKRR